MDIIHLLPDNIANQIAAGEVVQRPASVVKELLENSVDAGADVIELRVTDAGKTSICVIDNGKGMSETDARMAFERHATSKIKDASDLFNLHTMGFRGEALASIASVAQVTLTTRTEDDEIGVRLVLNGPQVVESVPVACPRGAQFAVNNLFFNVPARRRFLKSDATELKSILQEFERVALIYPDIEFTFYKDDVRTVHLPQGSFKKRIADLFGSSIDKDLLPVHVETSIVKVDGFLGTPQSARQKGFRQFFFVNDRFMKHPYFHRAVITAFEQLIPSDKQISYFYRLEVDPSKIDVNIHPTKTEIKFEDEQSIWQILLAVTKETLGSFNAVPVMDFEESATPAIPVYNPKPVAPPTVSVDKDYNPFRQSPDRRTSVNTAHWQKLYEGIGLQTDSPSLLAASPSPDDDTLLEKTDGWSQDEGTFLQFGRYILTSVRTGLMLIDQHRAHVRILYDQYMDNISGEGGVSQGMLFPELFQLSVSQTVALGKIMPELRAVGFDISDMGGGSYAVNGVPAGIEKKNPVEMIRLLLDRYNEKGLTQAAVQSSIALHLAKCNAVAPSRKLTPEEMAHIVSRLLQCKSPRYTPEGKAVITILDEDRLSVLLK